MSSGRYHHDYYGKRRRSEPEPRFSGHYQSNNPPPGRWGKRSRPECPPHFWRRYSNGNASTGSRGSAASIEDRDSACGNNGRNAFPVKIHPKLAGRFVPPPLPKATNKQQQSNPPQSWQLVEPAPVATTPDLTEASPASEPSVGECTNTTTTSAVTKPPSLVQVSHTEELALESVPKEGTDWTAVEEQMLLENQSKPQNGVHCTHEEQNDNNEYTMASQAANTPTLELDEQLSAPMHDVEISPCNRENTKSSTCVGREKMSPTCTQRASTDFKADMLSVKIPRKVRSSPTTVTPLVASGNEGSFMDEEQITIDTAMEQVPLPSATVPQKAHPVNDGMLAEIQVGTRVAVFWDGENEFFAGTVTKQRNAAKPFYLEYDDGDREWIDFSKHVFKVLACEDRDVTESSQSYVEETKVSKRSICQRENAANQMIGDRIGSNAVELSLPALVAEEKSTACAWEASYVGLDSSTDDWVAAGLKRCQNDSSDSDTDEEELMEWATNMLGAPRRSPAVCKLPPTTSDRSQKIKFEFDPSIPVNIPISEKVKLRRKSDTAEPSRLTLKIKKHRKKSSEDVERLQRQKEEDEAKKRKESARWLTEEEIRTFLNDQECPGDEPEHWVRRSMRQPSKNILQSPLVKCLLEKLRSNDPDMVVLKLKKYLADPATPCLVIDATLDALEENTNCEALFIQNFNVGMRDAQVLRLLEILKKPSCKIWCLNIGETYNVRMKTWKKFAKGLRDTKITHTYLSEHTITTELKDRIRDIIRENRNKHTMHCDPDNLDTIVRCTHCWWNPINTKSLRPYLRKRGLEHMLNDKDLQGLKGSSNGADIK